MKKNIYRITLALSLGAALMFVSSCSKNDDQAVTGTSQKDLQRTKAKINQFVKRFPVQNLVHELRTRGNVGTVQPYDFTFANPSSGYTYSHTSTYTTSTGTTYTTNSYTVYAAYNSFGAGANGGTVVAGNTSLDMNYVFCFSSSDQGFGLDLFGTGAPVDGVSSVIGVSGDFSQLQNANDSTSLGDIFHGLAFYLVYDDNASGSYDVINFSDVTWSDSTSINHKCFAFIFDFVNGRFFVSKSGTINVSGGSMTYNGEYYQITGFLNGDGNFDITGPDANLTLSVVSGFGTMGCN